MQSEGDDTTKRYVEHTGGKQETQGPRTSPTLSRFAYTYGWQLSGKWYTFPDC